MGRPSGTETRFAMSPAAAWCVGLVGCAALTLSTLVLLRSGFSGISNDDAARTLIAVDFSLGPVIDPTRSSWLPVPTYLLGALLRASTSIVTTARVLSLAAGCADCVLAAALARAVGARAVGACVAVLFAATWRWSVVASIAPGVPEMTGVAFVLVGAWALMQHGDGLAASRGWAVVAGVALACACGCRYEAWFAAASLVAVATVVLPQRERAWIAGGIALLSPLAWMLLNAHRQGDPFEFLHRVESFRRAEGLAPWTVRAMVFPRLIVRELIPLVVLAVMGLRRPRTAAAWLLTAGALSVTVALECTELRGGGASHHPARALILVAWLLVPVAARGFDALLDGAAWQRAMCVVIVAMQGVLMLVGRPAELSSVARDAVWAGRDLGAVLRSRPNARCLVEPTRQDFLWVELASEVPSQCVTDRSVPAMSILNPPGIDVAAVSSERAVSAFLRGGWTVRARHGSWNVLVR